MNDTTPMPVNHHGDHPGFAGLTGTLFAAVFLLAGRAGAALAGELTSPAAGDHVVDIGCGPGNAVRAAVRRGARATGVDPSAAMLRVARTVTRDKAATWAEGSAEALPVADACATHVWALATVHHWRDVPTALTEIRRMLAPGGRLLAIERRTEPGATGYASHGWTAQQAESFAALCSSAGLVDVDVTTRQAGKRAVWAVCARRP
ncbi:class I SAM-dependent methyltransferase [Mycolicibacterium sp. S3B2]|uniref:class I SAM-dependent methyltransferase n=1 Tax=Mycolicibacterium sp. S3B2 TaxID=3415120 RepID=UPI003C7BA616